ncbi:MAG TPA: AAC(3) family N-acetyltransferase [Anaerolineales bacterium]|nr:AAC(3) family N-acetyltransferase [Anaerolineales bacterium]
MPDYKDLYAAFQALCLQEVPVIAHASLKPFGYIEGGPGAVLKAMLACFAGVIMPTHTYKTKIIPEVGPPNNGIVYGNGIYKNKMAQPFHPEMKADSMMGALPETLRCHPSATRTAHPILSFAGINADFALFRQTLYEPLAPIGVLAEQNGWAVLINVDHTVNTSIHYAEKLAGRKQFVRWALVDERVVECPNYPGDSMGFQAIEEHIRPDIRRVDIGEAFIDAVPLKRLFEVVQKLIRKNPLALLCENTDCERCAAVRITGK